MEVRPLDLGRGVRFDPPFVLAPMEGVTHRVFRDLLLDAGGPGAAWTEFLRVSQVPLRAAAIRRELGPPRADVPVGVQLMGTDPDVVAETAKNAVAAGAPMIDLNFGCPAPVVFNKCAGSAMLDHPDRLHALVAAVAGGGGGVQHGGGGGGRGAARALPGSGGAGRWGTGRCGGLRRVCAGRRRCASPGRAARVAERAPARRAPPGSGA
ncbi:MAG: tRNA-dihydrouridine synthase family protein, partial [Planctomycetota bacterium]|nr:tRNA-dihydrouridine synthase family protein [Planctomycetota bacterium]